LGIAANLIADDTRRRAREWEALRRLGGRRVLDGEEDLLRIESQIDATRITPAVLQELQKLPPSERVAIDLVAFDGLTQEEAAEALDIDPVAFRMRLSRARAKLRNVMAPEDEVKGVIAR
jgi:RNA polymerase sigma-70 factor (ECF subfamily)